MITQIDGWWWPEADRRARPVIVGDAGEAVASILKHIEGRTCIVQAGGKIVVMPIDALGLLACDAIWLDVEGSEYDALMGAQETIARFAPTIAFEEKGLGKAYGVPDGAVGEWLRVRGYAEVARIGNDKVFRKQQ